MKQPTPTERKTPKRARRLPLGGLIMAAAVVLSVPLLASIDRAYDDFALFDGQLQQKQAQLTALEAQDTTAKRRLTMLDSNKGRAQILIERGYVRPGERILLFPETKPSDGDEQSETTSHRQSNDLVLPPSPAERTVSPLKRAARGLGAMWQTLRGISAVPENETGAGVPPNPSATPAVQKQPQVQSEVP